jgi:hypothetical protein
VAGACGFTGDRGAGSPAAPAIFAALSERRSCRRQGVSPVVLTLPTVSVTFWRKRLVQNFTSRFRGYAYEVFDWEAN